MEKLTQFFTDALLIAEPLYGNNKAIWDKWTSFSADIEKDNSKVVTSQYISPSFSVLVSWLSKKNEEGITSLQIAMRLHQYKNEIHSEIEHLLTEEFKKEKLNNKTVIQVEKNGGGTDTKDYFEVNNSAVYFKLRDGISKNHFEDDSNMGVKSYPIETKESKAIAQLSSHRDEDLKLIKEDEAFRWNTLVNDVMSNMDDLTADVLDSITIQWLAQAQSPDEFIEFSYEQVLDMCNVPKKKVSKGEYYRPEDKIKVAKRIAALASIFIYLNDDNEVVVLNDENENDEEYKVKREVIKRLFVLDSVVLWRHNTTNEYMGIESCRIKPGSFLANYLYDSNNTTALLSKKALEYNSYRHKYHKRLIRYLTWQWRIRQIYSTLKRPYSIGGDKGLLAVMAIPLTWKPGRIREHLENVLTDLERENVISKWEYSIKLDEERLNKKSWFKEYWINLNITILPPEELMKSMYNLPKKKTAELENNNETTLEYREENKDIINMSQIKISKESDVFDEEAVRAKILKRHTIDKISIRELAKEIKISAPTLSRFYNKQTKRLSANAVEKMSKWYKRQVILEMM
ncbi:helix-turn-helix domain-containing protein [Bacillus toyonensis]|uniref:helix-turn-helix domain-containing protein n=1 Tax=Bacillus toyonensis TaxID=155322 RepID=UPI0018A19615|nr:helix-turn-helix transcriptional regulator [Bacillus toyonensis]MBF7150763.1 helix-turn-helix domain-containing protein [Bacillus toyonensis]MEC2351538.1 helix-turn-helix transcriptional regulator [Bacillus toyonensis]MED3189662.1 helix-turn-helix transcriptional regulator [Bacillus toyonensis]